MTTESNKHIPSGDRPSGNMRGTRSPAIGRRGMIATSQALASAAGLQVLQAGGNAIDAAVTAAAVLAVIEPSMNGIGGDLLALVYDAKTKKVYGLDSTGRSAHAATPAEYAKRGVTDMPTRGPLVVDVPGVVEGWDQLLKRFGTISLADALAPAIAFARDGFPVAELMANEWLANQDTLAADPATAATFLPNGVAPKMGEIFANPRLARSLAIIAKEGRDAFYSGSIARAIVADMQLRSGLLDLRDFADHKADWVEPISTSYRGYDVLEMPPSTQGFVALEMLNILEGFDIASLGHNSADYLHVISEAKRIAFADRGAFLADRDHMPKGSLQRLISKDYAASRRRDIHMNRAAAKYSPDFAGVDHGDTIYMTAADGQGNVISFIQSLFNSFGAGFVAGDTGITMHNRGSGFTLQPGHPNEIGPHKRPLHTLVPAMLAKNGRP
ncbi:MAG TPA: gamma-glutamyltransferase family protein, partial [Vicinamibacterales bacterium]|nr:gamma-glutamyltransferase family protein [Vicinamibacterales bacterium]